jgi:hypothetical protein
MKLDTLSPAEIAQYYTDLLINNLISMWGTSNKEVKKINDKTHFGILKVGKHIDMTFPQSVAIIDELGKIDIPEAEYHYIKLSIAFGVNAKDVFKRLRKLLFECESKDNNLSTLTDEGKRNSSLLHLLKIMVLKTNRNLCYNLPNVNQKNIAYYDKEFLRKQFAIFDKRNGGSIDLDK